MGFNSGFKGLKVIVFQNSILGLYIHFVFLIPSSEKPCFISKYPFVADNWMQVYSCLHSCRPLQFSFHPKDAL